MFGKKSPSRPPAEAPELLGQRLRQLVRETLDRPAIQRLAEGNGADGDLDLMALLVELRAAAKRGTEPVSARHLGPEFARYLTEFYNLPAELQPQTLGAFLDSRRHEQAGDLAAAVEVCQAALEACPTYPPLLERLARLEQARDRSTAASGWYGRLLDTLDALHLRPIARDICRAIAEGGFADADLLDRCARRLEGLNEPVLAARCWADRAGQHLSAGYPLDALSDLERALELQPDDPRLYLDLAQVYERLDDVDRAAAAFEQAAALAVNDLQTLARVLLIRARISRPDEAVLGRLMDLLDEHPDERDEIIRRCEDAALENPYNPHLQYVRGVLLAQDGLLDAAVAALRLAADRYAVQTDRSSELEARLALQQLDPRDETNGRRVAELHFERGEVHLAMQALAGLAKLNKKS